MNTRKISIALAAAAGLANAQTPAPLPAEDAAARQQAAAASQKANAAAAKAEEAAKAVDDSKEKVEAVEGKVDGLNESYLETKATVAGLAKLKISGLIQAQAVYYLDTNILSGARPQQQTQFLVRRGRLKATYDAGNGSVFVLSLIHISEPTRLGMISYAVFCLKKKNKTQRRMTHTTQN
eukprot:TRINITY_DN17926_c0_g1_i2.p3 TRINITY_DN17926_c0_g1~~TRINITY_DN17926_c0_g1_i2.p3  ORF type:complete len:180 (-),score=32.10 TRINITY_DN17926_c0_g1_i2:31-570(-)